MLSKSKPKSQKFIKSSSQQTHFLLGERVVFWILIMMTIALVTALFGKEDVRTLLSESQVKIVEQPTAQEPDNATTPYIILEDDYIKYCYTENPGPAETYFTYLDKKTSVSMVLPYSFSWGDVRCPVVELSQFGENKKGRYGTTVKSTIMFGPGNAIMDNGGVPRETRLITMSATSAAAVRSAIIEQYFYDKGRDPKKEIRQRAINGMTVYDFKHHPTEDLIHHWIAVGRNYVYELESTQWVSNIPRWLTDAEAIKIIQSLRVSK